MTLKSFAAALLVSWTAVAQAQEAKPAPFTFALHGFVSMSAYMQDGLTGLSEGQQSLFAAPPTLNTDKASLGFDVRQSRFNFSVKGPQVFMGATPSAVLELDFMQGFGGGAFGNVSLLNRMRLAYSELNWGNHRIAFGQMNDLTFAQAPYSLSHIAFPLGYGTGNIGWRRPGIFGFHTFGEPDARVEFAWEIGRSQWNDAAAGGIGNNTYNTPGGISLGEASALPAIQARLTLSSGKLFSVWAAGHWNRFDMNGVGTTGSKNIDTLAGTAGAKVTYSPVTLAAVGFYGKNTGNLLGNLVQLQAGGATATTPAAATFQDVNAWGFWAQAGVNVTNEFSLWGLYGMQKPDQADAKVAQFTRLQNDTANVMAQYRDGGYAISLEWIYFKTKTATYATGVFASSKNIESNQAMLTANYFF